MSRREIVLAILVVLAAVALVYVWLNSNKIAILAPVEGDTWQMGQTYTIEWRGALSKTVNIQLLNRALEKEGASAAISSRADNVLNTEEYPFQVPTGLTPGEYRIYISGEKTEGYSGYFNISQ